MCHGAACPGRLIINLGGGHRATPWPSRDVLFRNKPPLYISRSLRTQVVGKSWRQINPRLELWVGPAKHTRKSRELTLQNVILKSDFIQDLQKLNVSAKLIVGVHYRPVYLANLTHVSLSKNIALHTVDAGHHAPRQKPRVIASFFTN